MPDHKVVEFYAQVNCCHSDRYCMGPPHKHAALSSRLRALCLKGAEPTSLLKEASSYDTIGNGFFAMTIHAVPAGWRCASQHWSLLASLWVP